MANSNYLFFLQIACLIILLSLSPSSAHTKSRKSMAPAPGPAPVSQVDYKGCFSKVYAFGGSYTDTGNAYLMGGFQSFIGKIFSMNPFGSTGHRQCNGRLVIDYLCDALSMPPLSPYKDSSSNFSNGANFAIAGSTALSSDFFSRFNIGSPGSLMWKSNPESFQTQIDWFHKFVAEKECMGKDEAACKAELENVLFWIGEIGGDDYSRLSGSSAATKQVTEQAVGHVYDLLKAMLDKGAKYVVVHGLPPSGCFPLHLTFCPLTDRDQNGCSKSANSVIMAHNELLQKKLEEIRNTYKDCMIIYVDYYRAYQTILTNLQKYQFQEPFKACCGSGKGPFHFDLHSLCGSIGTSTCKDSSQHISWDGLHLTETMHQHLADLFFNQSYCKPSFAELVKKKKGY